MSGPFGSDMTQIISAASAGLVANANRLGLTWRLYLGTVGSSTDATISIKLDGDSEFLAAESMIGPLAPGQRVYVINVPPGNNFVVGQAGVYRLGCTLRRVANQTLPDSGAFATTVSWDMADYNPAGLWNRNNPTRVTMPVDGLYSITYTITTGAATTVGGRAFISVVTQDGRFWRSSFSNGEQIATVGITLPFSALQWFTCEAYADMTGASTLTGIVHCYRVGM